MKELSAVDVANVSGAGKIQNALGSFFGDVFGKATTSLNENLSTGYDVASATQTGNSFGSSLGLAVENIFNKFLSDISKRVVG